MKSEKLEVVRGSGNVFHDLGRENADAEQFKAILAAEIIKTLDRELLTVRAAHSRTGIAAADFSRIRNADLGRFTVDRLMSIINRLGSRVEVKIRVRRAGMIAGWQSRNQRQTPVTRVSKTRFKRLLRNRAVLA
jgi:predicted XRE-type DNA-binding protein